MLWEYSYNERGKLQIFRKPSFLLKQYLAGTQDRTAVIVMTIECSLSIANGPGPVLNTSHLLIHLILATEPHEGGALSSPFHL